MSNNTAVIYGIKHGATKFMDKPELFAERTDKHISKALLEAHRIIFFTIFERIERWCIRI
jgi:hypothetical protein